MRIAEDVDFRPRQLKYPRHHSALSVGVKKVADRVFKNLHDKENSASVCHSYDSSKSREEKLNILKT